jgi:hypothetical protein
MPPVKPVGTSTSYGSGDRVAIGALGGAGIGFVVGAGLGLGAAALVAEGWENDECTDCDRNAFALIPIGALMGIVPGAVIGGVIASNRVKRDRLAVVPVGPAGAGLTIVGVF